MRIRWHDQVVNLLMFLLTLAVVAGVVAAVAGRLPGGMPAPATTVPPVRLPDGPITGADVDQLRFVPALRGYRMDQVDDTLDRLAREVDRLRALLPADALPELGAAREQQPTTPAAGAGSWAAADDAPRQAER